MPEKLRNTIQQQIEALKKSYERGGVQDFDRICREMLTAAAALIAHVEGPRRLHEMLDTIKAVHPIVD